MRLGINLNDVTYYESDLKFIDLMLAGTYFGPPYGWWIPAKEGYCPKGNYTLTSPGIGTIQVIDDVGLKTCVFNNDNAQYTLVCTNSYKRWLLYKHAEDSGNPMVPSLYPQGQSTAPIFAAEYLTDVRRFYAFRTVHFYNIEASTETNWNDANQTRWKQICALSNATGAIPWINLPHLATADYCTQLGALFATYLNPGIAPYLEYSNEVWNFSYPWSVQTSYVRNAALANGFNSGNWRGQYAIFADACFNAFATGFGRSFNRILAGQHYSVASITTCLDYADAHGISYDSIASAPYCNFTPDWPSITALWNAGDTAGALALFYQANYTGLTSQLTPAIQQWSTVARARGKPLIGYEWAPNWIFGSDPTKQAIGTAAANDVQMYDFIHAQYAALASSYSFANFYNYCEVWGGGKFWGAKQNAVNETSQRWLALLDLSRTSKITSLTTTPSSRSGR